MTLFSLRDVLLSLIVGLVVGGIVGLAKLPVPAPPTIAGVTGILGITLGWYCVRRFVT